MDSVNFEKNIKKVDNDYALKKEQKTKKNNIERKTAEASSLEALSSYVKAQVTFKGNVPSDDFERRLKDIKQKIKQNPDEYGWLDSSLEYINNDNIIFVEQLCLELNNLEKPDILKEIYKKHLKNAFKTMQEDINFVKKLWYSKDETGKDLFPEKLEIALILGCTNSQNREFAKELCFGKDENGNDLFSDKHGIRYILGKTNTENMEFARELCFGKNENDNDLFWDKNSISGILAYTNADNIEFARELCFGKDENGKDLFLFSDKYYIADILQNTNTDNIEFAREFCLGNLRGLFSEKREITETLRCINSENAELAKVLCYSKNCNDLFYQRESLLDILKFTRFPDIEDVELIKFIKKLCLGKDETGNELFPQKDSIISIWEATNEKNIELVKELCFGKNKNGNDLFRDKDKIKDFLNYIKAGNINLQTHLKMLKDCEITSGMLIAMFDKNIKLSMQDIRKLKSVLGFKAISALSSTDLNLAAKMIDLANKKDINEIDLTKKKTVIKNLVSLNTALYSASDELKQLFPLIPSNKEEYCSILKTLCKSIGIQTNDLTPQQTGKFYKNIADLSSSLSKLTDEQFNNLEFKQEYPKEEFIKNTFKIVKDLSSAERQKVYDCFGFELKHNDNGTQADNHKRHSFSIIGYPINLNSGKKLTEIENKNTKAVVEQLRPEVIKFSENNHVSCTNKEIEILVNEVLNLCPELRTQIGRKQAGFHEFDVFKHSLKVMQKIVQNPKFGILSESDKKIMLMASIFHDITKAEAQPDPLHPNECSFDTFYITKKFDLTKKEENKLYELIKNHEWLGYTNRKDIKTEEERKSRIKSVAYDLRNDNLFELSKIFTEADLKSVCNSDFVYDKVKDVFNINSSRVEAYINELKTTQPLLPVTQIPSSNRIKKAVTSVISDGSTNLKGIYQDDKGMIIIKFNEVENDTWEKIGFPKGSVSKGINATGYARKYGSVNENTVDTGNIKFFAHGLDYSEQMRNFDAFTLPDSDALLSVSYMERPESKYKLFRTQGLLLDVDTKDVHGGGETDSGSGVKKSLDLFKKDYAFSNGDRHSDRVYVAELIKKELNLTNDEYVEFVKNNTDKPISEIEPKEYQEPLVKAFATINSNTRKGKRSYNEMYVTNPRAMGVFAYSSSDNVRNVTDFVESQKDFLKNYALEEDLPFIVFGD